MSNTINEAGAGPFSVGAFRRFQAMFPATINVADPAGLTDLNFSTLSIDAAGRLRVLASAASGAIFPVTPAVLATSVGQQGRAVGPGAGAAIVTLAAPPAGTYDVNIWHFYDGAVAAAELNNIDYRIQGAVQYVLLAPVLANDVREVRTRAVLNGAQNLSLNAVAAATAGVGYNGLIVATRVA